MYQLNLPTYDLRLRRTGNRDMIFDVLRRKYVALTPEEWVRQHFVHFLIEHKGYPTALLANEIELRIGEKHLRADTLLYNKELRPHMLIEYKSPTIALTQKVFDQISAYNLLLHADYLIVSNGMQHICCRMDYEQNTYHFLEEIPDYSEITK
ncbi:MAG: type I restriction enzyme HsdR N-terminal domain-containing protein [Prevotella sp.]|nr:type I restriction enzyme HsdR N-terminal domain-containing protein [Prevotella sp.]